MERMAINAIIQGTDADIMKRAMVRIHEMCDHEIARPLLQIHDEMIYEIRDDMISETVLKIREIMELSGALLVPLTVEVAVGKRWGELKLFSVKS